MTCESRILVVDNYDSFVYTIVDYLRQLGATTHVLRNDELEGVHATDYSGVLISPGPGEPCRAGESPRIIAECEEHEIPMLGVCLGHQGLAEAHGGTIDRAPELMHGKVSSIIHDGTGIFDGLPSPLEVTRYHSLALTSETPEQLRANARTAGGIVMAVEHRTKPLWGVQFHPEAVLTQGGHRMLANWLALTGITDAVERSEGLSPLIRR